MNSRHEEGVNDSVLFDKYLVLDSLGKGGIGKVLLTEHIYLGVKRAIKKIKKGKVTRESFYNETSILKNLKHPGIPIIYDIEEDDLFYYIIEEYIDGESMSSYFTHKSCDFQDVIIYSVQICEILEYIHNFSSGAVVHLDIKPQNILIKDHIVFLVDFGSSLMVNGDINRYCMGTNNYSAPEYIEGKIPDIRCDVYSFGKVLMYMFDNSKIRISSDMLCIINKCIEDDINLRFSSISPVKNYLLQFQIRNKISTCQKVHKVKVYGTQSRVGTTHFALALTTWLSVNGISALYIECNNSGHACEIKKSSNDNCMVIPRYGETIDYEYEGSVFIEDWGTEYQEIDQAADANIVIAGGKAWEYSYVIDFFQKIGMYDFFWIVNFANEDIEDTISMQFNTSVHFMPLMKSPYDVNNNNDFFRTIVNCLMPELVIRKGERSIRGIGRYADKKIFGRFKK